MTDDRASREKQVTVESQIIPSLTEGLFLFDSQGYLVRLNPSGERLIARSEKAMMGKPSEDLFPNNPELTELITEALREGRPITKSGVQLINADRTEFYLTISASPLLESDGSVQGVVVLARDETLIREIDRSFRRADQLATLGTLNLGMAHEIKNPLGGIKGATQLLRSELGEENPLMENCEIILREVQRIDQLLENLLAAAPRENQLTDLLNIHEVLNDVIELMGHWTDAKDISFTKIYDPSLPQILGDRNGLVQVFLNLLKNSVEACQGKGVVTVRTMAPVAAPENPALGRRGGVLEVDIEDEGSGFDPSIESFSTPFFTTKPKGVGLGLAISEQIIQNHGGNLLLENQESSGARIRVILPLALPEESSN
jgi:PAS domain S-box-containing protein